ncbi:MAG: SDR family NAD(P)-dependent oxidoreductase [Pseudomonadota bacterium]
MHLAGKHAFITGGGTGIGLAIARALAAQGAKVTITGRRQEVLDHAADEIGALPLALDVTDPVATLEVTSQAITQNGPVQICVANAGIAEGKALHKMDLAFWRQIMATNLDGAMLTIQACLPSMLEGGWGRVIGVSSIAGVRGLRGAPAYTASKHGLIGLLRSLSEDHMGGPVTFNALCPGYVDTEIVTRNTTHIAARAGISEAEARDIMIRSNRHKRLIAPEEVASAATWLCGPGSGSINGQTIEIAGGQV